MAPPPPDAPPPPPPDDGAPRALQRAAQRAHDVARRAAAARLGGELTPQQRHAVRVVAAARAAALGRERLGAARELLQRPLDVGVRDRKHRRRRRRGRAPPSAASRGRPPPSRASAAPARSEGAPPALGTRRRNAHRPARRCRAPFVSRRRQVRPVDRRGRRSRRGPPRAGARSARSRPRLLTHRELRARARTDSGGVDADARVSRASDPGVHVGGPVTSGSSVHDLAAIPYTGTSRPLAATSCAVFALPNAVAHDAMPRGVLYFGSAVAFGEPSTS